MKIATRGIILQSTRYSETSLVVKIYTEQAGLASFIVSGVRTKNSRFSSNLFQPLSLVELVAASKPGQSMHRITDIQLSPPFTGIPGDMIKSAIAIFLAEVIYRSIREEEASPSLFAFLHNGIQILDLSPVSCSRFHIFFMIHFSRHLGFFPNGNFTRGQSCFDLREGLFKDHQPVNSEFIDSTLSGVLHDFVNSSFENYHEINVPGSQSRLLLKALVQYFELHQTHGNSIRSHKVLEEVLN